MLVQLRISVPADRTDDVRALFVDHPGTASVALFPGASVEPAGDLVVADVAREAADGLLTALRDLHLDRDGSITLISVDAAVSTAARKAEDRSPGDAADAVVWEQVVRTVDADSRLSVSYLAFLTIATMLAAIAIVIDSPVLVIGAMVLGPEFSPLAALAVGIVHRRPRITRHGGVSLVVGFTVAILIAGAVALAARGLGWLGPETLTAHRGGTAFIAEPDRWSVVVAVLAGVAGVLSLTSAKSGALVGVFISVTTVPAAGDIALSLALGSREEFLGSATQLGVNLTGILVAATATLAIQSALWQHIPRATPDIVGRRSLSGRP